MQNEGRKIVGTLDGQRLRGKQKQRGYSKPCGLFCSLKNDLVLVVIGEFLLFFLENDLVFR